MIGWKDHLQNYVKCVERDVKLIAAEWYWTLYNVFVQSLCSAGSC